VKKHKHAQKNGCPILWSIGLNQFFKSFENSLLERHQDLDGTEYAKLIVCDGRIWDFSVEKLACIGNCGYSECVVSVKET